VTRVLVVSALLLSSLAAAAEPPAATVATQVRSLRRWRRYSLGIQFGAANTPGGHAGIPVAPYKSYGAHLATALTFRWEMNRWSAFDVGVGIPHVGLGLGLFSSYELYHRFATDRRDLVGLELYAAPGWQLAFAGPDWAARHGNDWVGFDYFYQGPLAFGVRFAAGARLVFVERVEAYVEAVPIVDFTPSVEPLFTLVAGARVRF
jgi:hypothetical protein